MKQSFVVKKEEIESEYFTTQKYSSDTDTNGYYKLSSDGENVFAKTVKNLKSKSLSSQYHNRYYIKCYTNKVPYDPFETHSIKEKKVSYADRLCKGDSIFLEVNYSIFNNYINFLKTENKNLLSQVIRDVK